MHVTNWIEQNTTMDMLLELVHNYKIPKLAKSYWEIEGLKANTNIF